MASVFLGLWRLGCAGLAVFVTGCGASRVSDQESHAHVASALCPLKTPGDWQAFVEAAVEDDRWVENCASGRDCSELGDDFANWVETKVLGTFEACVEDLALNPSIARCTARLGRFAPAWLRQHTPDSYGFSLDNASYTGAQTESDAPAGMMDPPPELLEALPERLAIELAARQNGWPYLTHDSGVGGVRIFITTTDPDGRFDQWLLVGLQSSAVVPEGSILSLIAVQKADDNGRALERARMHFRDYTLSAAPDSWSVALPELHDAKCFACHPSGLRTLIPTHGSVLASAPVRGEPGFEELEAAPDFGFQRLRALNERLLSYGLPDWNGAVDPGDHGPALGDALGCPSCHDGVKRGTINVSTDERTLRRKIVDELSMRAFAPGRRVPDERVVELLDRETTRAPALTDEEVAELERARLEHLADYDDFMAERFPSFKAWVLERSCVDATEATH